MAEKNIAFITSPLQLINLREFCHSEAVEKTSVTLVVKFSKNHSSLEALKAELGKDVKDWNEIVALPHRNKFIHLKKLIKKLKKNQWDFLVTGELTAWWQNIVASNLSYCERVLVDDGTMTLYDYEKYMKGGGIIKRKSFLKNGC